MKFIRRGKALEVSESDFTKLKQIVKDRKSAFHILEWMFLKKVLRFKD